MTLQSLNLNQFSFWTTKVKEFNFCLVYKYSRKEHEKIYKNE